MAVTHGHGNPHWNRDETILAMEVYLATRGESLGPKDERIVALSRVLRSLPYHSEAARKPTFRNADGAAFKVQNLRSLETGKGLGNVSNMDRAIFAEFSDRPEEVRRLAGLIRSGVEIEAAAMAANEDEADDEEFYEGRVVTRQHKRRERNRKLRTKLIKKRSDEGTLRCDMCGASHGHLPAELLSSVFEAHHVVPVADAGIRPTRLQDLALLCATCHRLIHRMIALRKVWVSVSEASETYGRIAHERSGNLHHSSRLEGRS